jgi:hypothetical protein
VPADERLPDGGQISLHRHQVRPALLRPSTLRADVVNRLVVLLVQKIASNGS